MNKNPQEPRPPETTNRVKTRRRWIIAGALMTVTALPVLFAQLAGAFWFFELFSHFRPHYALGYILLTMLLLIWRSLHTASIPHDPVPISAFVLLGLSLSQILVIFQSVSLSEPQMNIQEDSVEHSRLMRLINLNVLSENPQREIVLKYLVNRDPDFITLQEVTPDWLPLLEQLDQIYPYSSIQVSDLRRGIAVFAKIPPRDWREEDVNAEAPAFTGTWELETGHRMTLATAHPRAPVTPGKAFQRNQVIQAFPRLALNWGDEARVISGDMNLTRWSPLFRQLLKDAGVRNSTGCALPTATWRPRFAGLPLPFLKLPIDHVLVSPPVLIARREIGPYVGSDHLPLEVDFLISEP